MWLMEVEVHPVAAMPTMTDDKMVLMIISMVVSMFLPLDGVSARKVARHGSYIRKNLVKYS